MADCKNCGLCCYLYVDYIKIKCRHLVILSSDTSLCRIYKSRLGKVTHVYKRKKYYCTDREKSTYDYPGCPYNTDKRIPKHL